MANYYDIKGSKWRERKPIDYLFFGFNGCKYAVVFTANKQSEIVLLSLIVILELVLMFFAYRKIFKKKTKAMFASILSTIGSSILVATVLILGVYTSTNILIPFFVSLVIIATLPKYLIKRAIKKEQSNIRR